MGRAVPGSTCLLGRALRLGLARFLLAVLIAVPASAVIVSDDFSDPAGTLGPQWTFIDPLGDGTVQIEGVGTQDARAAVGVPAGAEHDAWTSGLDVPRIVQSVADVDFELEAKFDSAVGQRYQIQGFVFEDGSGDFVRFDVYGRSAAYAFAATVTAGDPTQKARQQLASAPTAPIYLQVQRVGDTWTYRQSWDGVQWAEIVSFVHAFAVSTAGVYVGNAGPDPAHTALVDYVFDTASPIVPEDGGGTGCSYVLDVTVIGSGSVDVDPTAASYDCDEVVTLTATPDAGNDFNGWSGDASGATSPLQLVMDASKDVTAEFIDLSAPPAIGNVQVTPLTRSARIRWDTNEPATSRVDYGPSPAYEDGFVADATLRISHDVQLTGLTPDSTVHYQITSEDADTQSSSTADASFVTLASSSDLSGIVSDDFSTQTLGGQWTLFDPRGDSTVDFVGGGTPDAHLRISVPAGVEHTAWTGTNTATRIMQPVNDVDFEFEAKFTSPLGGATYQSQGILVEESPGNYLRLEFYGTQSSLHVFAASFVGDAPTTRFDVVVGNVNPGWLRVTRAGDSWTVASSADGIDFATAGSFTHVMAPSSIGVHAGNSGSNPPAHTALIDYAFSTASPVSPEDGFEPCNHTLTLGTAGGAGSVAVTPDKPTYECDEQVTIEAFPGAAHRFDSWSGDAGGATNPLLFTMTGNLSVTANFSQISAPPVITDIQVAPGTDSATISWETDEPATSRVDYGVRSGSLNLSVESLQLVTLHAEQLAGLTPNTQYYFRVSSEDVDTLGSTSSEVSFVTLPLSSDPSGIDSDDFSRNNLDVGIWGFTDPGGDAKLHITGVGGSSAMLELALASGVAQGLDGTADLAPRITQPASNVDFSLEVKFESTPSADGQRQGLIVDGSGGRLRFDYSHDGSGLRAGAAWTDAGGETTRLDASAPSASELFLRLERTANTWTLLRSTSGSSWTPVGSFAQTLVVGAVGLFAANAPGGGSAPAFTARVDSFESDADALVDEDGSAAPDALPPLIHAISSSVTETSVELRWTTDEPSSSTVYYGQTPSYELGSVDDPTPVNDHVVTVQGLLPDTPYYFGLVSEDGLSQSSSAPDLLVLTAPTAAGPGPAIELFYGSVQSFGDIGIPQPWANVLGNVSDPDGVTSLSYELNGGAPRALSMGPDDRRLPDPGDFNADIATSDLVVGANNVLIRAFDSLGNESTRNVVVNYDDSNIWPANYSIDWSTVTDIQDVAQVVDGRWIVQNGTLQNEQLAYDRLVAIGDLVWQDVEVEVPVTVHGIDPGGFDPPSTQPAVGILLRWPGHRQRSREQPFIEFKPLGAIGWVVFTSGGGNKLQIYPNSGGLENNNDVPNLEFDVTYVFKFRVDQIAGVGGLYRFKMWEQGTAEPGWQVEKQQSLSDPQQGSALLIAHHADVDFGNVIVRPLGNQSPITVGESYSTTEEVPLDVSVGQGVLANDSDPENDPLVALLVTDVSSGVLSLDLDGSFDYTPADGFSGQDSFEYQAYDGFSSSSPTTVTIDVDFVDDVPTAGDDDYETAEGVLLVVDAISGVLANDDDPDGFTLSAVLETDVSDGVLDLASDGSFDYAPDSGFSGADSFTYRAFDGVMSSAPATVTIQVEDPPTALDDAYGTDEDTTLDVDASTGVLANDSDPQSDPLQAQLVGTTSRGSISLATDGSFTYIPDPGFSGNDSFTYLATDGSSSSDPATVLLTVTAVDDPPTAVNDEYDSETDTPLVVPAVTGVLANDSDPEQAPLSALLVSDVSDGVIDLLADGSFSYTPDPGFFGVDSFTYQASDGSQLSNLAAATLNVGTGGTLDGLVAHWPLDTGSGSTASDASDSGWDGAIQGAIWTTGGPDGSPHALDFDGVDDYVDVGGIDVGGTEMTIALWFNADDWDKPDARLISKAIGTANDEHFWMISTIKLGGRRIRARLSTDGAVSTLIANSTVSKNAWFHVAITYDGAALRIYQDGAEVGSLAQTGAIDVDPSVFAAIGNQAPGAGSRPFDGAIDDVRIYDRALSGEEIGTLMESSPPGP